MKILPTTCFLVRRLFTSLSSVVQCNKCVGRLCVPTLAYRGEAHLKFKLIRNFLIILVSKAEICTSIIVTLTESKHLLLTPVYLFVYANKSEITIEVIGVFNFLMILKILVGKKYACVCWTWWLFFHITYKYFIINILCSYKNINFVFARARYKSPSVHPLFIQKFCLQFNAPLALHAPPKCTRITGHVREVGSPINLHVNRLMLEKNKNNI